MAQGGELHDNEARDHDEARGPLLRAVETLRSTGASPHALHKPIKAGGEERISLPWRLFGGTLLSIAALVCLTAYQQLTSTLSELRNNLNHLNESRGDLVKTDDFNSRMTALWNTVKELQAAGAALSALKERSVLLEQQIKVGQDQLRTSIDAVRSNLKELDAVNAAVSALKERSTLVEQQFKAGEDERKELARELQQLRERQAAIEVRQAGALARSPADQGSK
jgi:hypothetical protein